MRIGRYDRYEQYSSIPFITFITAKLSGLNGSDRIGGVVRKDLGEPVVVQSMPDDLGEYVAVVGGNAQVARLFELGIGQPRPAPEHLPSRNARAHQEHHSAAAMVGAVPSVLLKSPAEHCHAYKRYAPHLRAKIPEECRESARKVSALRRKIRVL